MSRDEIVTLNTIWPEIVEFGSMGAVVEKRFAEIGSELVAIYSRVKNQSFDGVRVEHNNRSVEIRLAPLAHFFLLEYREDGVCVAYGSRPDLQEVVASVVQWLSDMPLSVSELTLSFPFLVRYEDGVEVEGFSATESQWQNLLWRARFGKHGNQGLLNPNLPELVLAASQQRKLRRLFPHGSHDQLHFRRCSQCPRALDTPWLLPMSKERRFRVYGTSNGENSMIAEGEACEIVQIAADQIPDDLSTVWEGSANEEGV